MKIRKKDKGHQTLTPESISKLSREELEQRLLDLENRIQHMDLHFSKDKVANRISYLNAFFMETRDGVVVVDPSGIVLDANRAYCDMLGYTLTEILRIGDIDTFTPEKWKAWENEEIREKKLFKDGYSGIYEKEYIRKDGSIFPIEVQSYGVFDDQGKPEYFLGFVRDITSRQESEAALRESEEKLRSYFDHAPHGVFISDEKGNYIQVNKAACKITGYTELELTGMNLIKLIPEDNAVQALEHFQSVQTTGFADGELKFVHKNGEHRWWRIAAVRLSNNRFMGFTTDTTERHKAEERYTALFNQMLNGFALHEMIYDENGKPVDYRFLAVNPAFERMTHLKADEVVGKTVLEVMPDTESYLIDAYGKVARNGKTIQFENYSRELGEYFSVTAYSPAPDQFVTVFEDITERKRTELALQESEERYQSFINTHKDLIFIKDNELKYLVVNEATLEFFGMKREQIIGKTDFDIMGEEGARQCLESDQRALLSGKPVISIEHVGYRIFETTKFPIRLGHEKSGIGAIIRDVTDEKQAAETISRLNDRFELAAEAATIGVWDLNLANNHLIWDDRMFKLYGITREDFASNYDSWEQYVHPDDLAWANKQVGMALSGEKELDLEFRILHPDGSIHHLAGKAIVLTDETGKPYRMAGVNYDITALKETEQALRHSESLAHTVLENSPVGISVRAADGQLLLYNQAWVDIWEISPDRLARDLAPREKLLFNERDEYLGEHQLQVKRVFTEGGTYDVPVIHTTGKRSKTKRRKYVSQHFSGIKNEKGEVERVVILTTDITEQTLAEEELRKSEERFRSFVENANDIVYALDPEGVFTYMSPNWINFVGISAEKAVGKPIESIIHPDDMPACYQFLHDIRSAEDKTRSVEYRIVRSDGTYRWHASKGNWIYDTDGKAIRFIGIARDVTQEKQTQAERERLIAAIEQAGETVVITNQQGVIEYVNPAFEKITGYSREEAIGRSPKVLNSGKQSQEFYRNLWQTILRGETWKGRFVNKKKDGSLYTEEANISPVRNQQGAITNFVAVKRDITRELELENQFMQAQKMESIGRLAGGIAHDFNNMLLVILGHAEMMLDEEGLNTDMIDSIKEIQHAAEHSADLTRQLLAFARKQTAAPRVLDLNHTVEGMLRMLRRLIGEGMDLKWIPGKDIFPVRIDPAQLDQILANLCVNARDAIDGFGTITIETDNLVLDEVYCKQFSGCQAGEYVRLSISDTGRGMSKTVQAKIFEPFFTTKDVGEGTGLGLATVYGIIMQNHGHVRVYSEPGKGTTFHIFLTAHHGIAGVSEQVPVSAPPAGNSEKVLLVDDEPAILKMGKTMLERLGYDVLTAQDPIEAMQIIENYPGTIDLLITDVVMPEMNGRDLALQLMKRFPDLKYLYISGYTANVIAQQGILDEETNFLQKPFSIHTLAIQVKEALGTKK